MLGRAEVIAYQAQLVLCPHCGCDGEFQFEGMAAWTRCTGCGHVSPRHYPSKDGVARLVAAWAEGSRHPVLELPTDAPLILNYGVGVDSTAMLVAMANARIRPDLIIFADVGNERPETYEFLDTTIGPWLHAQGFPQVTRVAYEPDTAPYTTLEGNCLANETLPSISISGKGGCTLKFKAAVMDRFLLGVHQGKQERRRAGWAPALEAIAAGNKPYKLIGYDAGPADSCRFKKVSGKDKNEPFRYLYPLQDLGWTREDCILAIVEAGLPVPIKSSCFFCLGTKPWEVYWLAAEHPDLLLRAIHMEDVARTGKHGLITSKGLWRSKSWREWCEAEGIIAPGGVKVIADPKEMREKARAQMPPLESNLDFGVPLKFRRVA